MQLKNVYLNRLVTVCSKILKLVEGDFDEFFTVYCAFKSAQTGHMILPEDKSMT